MAPPYKTLDDCTTAADFEAFTKKTVQEMPNVVAINHALAMINNSMLSIVLRQLEALRGPLNE